MTITLIQGDARKLALTDASVDLIVTSPPYFALRSYTDDGKCYSGQVGCESTLTEYIATLTDCTREWMRVLKPAGSMWINLGDKYNAYNGNRGDGNLQTNNHRQRVNGGNGLDVKGIKSKSLLGLPWRYALACIDQLGLILRAEVIWNKTNGMPESVTDRVRRNHEQWFHFVKQPRYFAAVNEIREPYAESNSYSAKQNDLGKLPGSVWTIATQPLVVPKGLGVSHSATFPMEWPRRIISGWSRPGGIIVDPFGGTGTTALVASALGRHGISVDMSADYCRLARWRTTDLRQIERARRPIRVAAMVDEPKKESND